MGAVAESRDEKRLGIVILLAGLLAGLILRFYLGSFAQMPGHGDSAFYFTVARNIAEGRGPVVDYIVYFFSGLLPLPHYAGDFWNPTAAYLIAIPMLLFGRTISAALIAPILAGVVPAISGFLAGRRYTGSTVFGALTGLLTFFSAFQVWFSVTTEAIIFAGAFGSVAIYFMMNREGSWPYFLLAALFTGLANLVRQDNILLLVTLEICVLMTALPWKRKLLVAVAAIVIHVMALSPLLILNEAHLGTLFPAGPAKTAFLTTYEDFHSYNKTIDWTTLRATFGIRGIITRRLHTGAENLGQVDYFLTPLLVILVVAALLDALLLRRDSARLWLLFPPAIFAILQYAFYTVVASLSGPGSLIKSLGTLMPFIAMAIVGLFARYSRSRIALIVVVGLVAAFSAYQGFTKNLQSTNYYNGIYA
ncbi:MAG TPA: glycosyltransferase family 39 protein, partial [Anaerolineales bacterium]